MRFEINIPDSIRPDLKAKLMSLTEKLSANPELVEGIHLNGDDMDACNGPKATPDLIASLRNAEADIDAGKGLTMAQVDKSLAAKKAAWLQASPH